MAERRTSIGQSGFQTAVDDLTDGLSHLVRDHFELARCEVRREVNQARTRGAVIAAGAAVVFVGYGVLNLAIILFAALWGGLTAAAIVALALAVLQIAGAAIAILYSLKRFKEMDMGLPETTEEIQRNKQWLKEIRNNSSPALPAET